MVRSSNDPLKHGKDLFGLGPEQTYGQKIRVTFITMMCLPWVTPADFPETEYKMKYSGLLSFLDFMAKYLEFEY